MNKGCGCLLVLAMTGLVIFIHVAAIVLFVWSIRTGNIFWACVDGFFMGRLFVHNRNMLKRHKKWKELPIENDQEQRQKEWDELFK